VPEGERELFTESVSIASGSRPTFETWCAERQVPPDTPSWPTASRGAGVITKEVER
jgi:hypothetical protein